MSKFAMIQDGSVTVSDATAPTPKSETGFITEGGLQMGEWTPEGRERVEIMSRGRVVAVQAGDYTGEEMTIECHSQGIGSALMDAMLLRGTWATAVSTHPSAVSGVHSKLLSFSYDDGSNVVTWKYCGFSVTPAEGKPGKVSIKIRAYNIADDWKSIA